MPGRRGERSGTRSLSGQVNAGSALSDRVHTAENPAHNGDVPGVGYAYVTSQRGTALTGDPRDVALRDALYAALRTSESMRGSSC